MKKSAWFFGLSLILLLPTAAQASVNVSISNNLDGSKNSVKINSQTSVHQSNSSSSQTDIVIEANGEKKEYHSSGESVKLESSDGTSKVEVNHNNSSPQPTSSNKNTSVKNSVKVETQSSPSSSPSSSPNPQVTEQKKEDLLSLIKQKLEELQNLLKSWRLA